MPLPMVHLAVAIRVHEMLGWKMTGEYLLGNIAPDAIHMRPGSGRSEKDAVHLNVGTLPEAEALEKVQGLLQKEYFALNGQPTFRTGYALHLLADHFWTHWIVVIFKDKLTAGMPDSEKRALYYRETDQVDFNLYHQVPWRPKVWNYLASSSPQDFDGLLTANEIQKWLARDLNWFERIKDEPRITPIFITDAITGSFIERAAERASKFFEDFARRAITA